MRDFYSDDPSSPRRTILPCPLTLPNSNPNLALIDLQYNPNKLSPDNPHPIHLLPPSLNLLINNLILPQLCHKVSRQDADIYLGLGFARGLGVELEVQVACFAGLAGELFRFGQHAGQGEAEFLGLGLRVG